MAIFLGIPLASLLHWILPVPGCSGCLFLGFVPCFDRGHHLVTFWGIIHTRTFFFPVKLHVWIILCSTLILDWWPECKIQGEVNFLSEFEDIESWLLLLRSSVPFWFLFLCVWPVSYTHPTFGSSWDFLSVPGSPKCHDCVSWWVCFHLLF